MSRPSAENPNIRILKLKSERVKGVHKMVFGKEAKGRPNRTIMFLGATGSGKTTLINGLINFIFGVRWEDDWRLKLIDEEVTTQAESQTTEVTAYEIHYNEDFQVPFSLTIVDTPGFDVCYNDKERTVAETIEQFFRKADDLIRVDVMCFVVQSSSTQLTFTQKHILNSVLSMFGEEIVSNIVAMITFADGKTPPVLEAIRAAEIPCGRSPDGEGALHFQFNNSALYVFKSPEDEYEDSGPAVFWKMGEKSNGEFFDHLETLHPRSFKPAKTVLKERQHLEGKLARLILKVKADLTKLEEIKAIEMVSNTLQDNFDLSNYHPIKVPVEKEKRVQVTFCPKCVFCCHESCVGLTGEDQRSLSVMSGHNCKVCPGKCHWSTHIPMCELTETVMVDKTIEELKEKYQTFEGENMNKEKVLHQLQIQHKQVNAEVLKMVGEIATSLSRLADIAQKPNPLSTVEYIELLIEAEERDMKQGCNTRILLLQEMRQQAVVKDKVL